MAGDRASRQDAGGVVRHLTHERLAIERRPLRPGPPPRRKAPLARRTSLLSAGSPGPQAFSRASDAQRLKVSGVACLVCGARDGVDPAHLTPRARGGCDHPDCVVPLCRFRCHRAFDDARLDLLAYLEPRHRSELAHALSHLGLIELLERLTAERWAPARREAA